jgi:hypothetical protein
MLAPVPRSTIHGQKSFAWLHWPFASARCLPPRSANARLRDARARFGHTGNSGPENRLVVPVGRCGKANPWRNIIVHQTEGDGVGKIRRDAAGEDPDPARRHGLGGNRRIVYWAMPEDAIPIHGDGANRNDNKYIDDGLTFRQVLKNNSIGVGFAGNFDENCGILVGVGIIDRNVHPTAIQTLR